MTTRGATGVGGAAAVARRSACRGASRQAATSRDTAGAMWGAPPGRAGRLPVESEWARRTPQAASAPIRIPRACGSGAREGQHGLASRC